MKILTFLIFFVVSTACFGQEMAADSMDITLSDYQATLLATMQDEIKTISEEANAKIKEKQKEINQLVLTIVDSKNVNVQRVIKVDPIDEKTLRIKLTK